ncbi:MAG: CoA-binding protein [Pseudomonadota bacterium]
MHTVRDIMDSGSLVVFGASTNPEKPGAMLLAVLKETGFKGLIAGINPGGGEVAGVRLYRSLAEVPFDPDLAVMLIPPRSVPEALLECATRNVKGVVISSEGFAETGADGRRLQDEVARISRETGIRVFGPNTLGLVNTATGMVTSYFVTEKMLLPGSIGFAAQSGIFVGAALRYLSSFEGLHLSKGLGLGNKADVDESDALEYFSRDEQTEIVGLYVEDIRDGRRFLETARAASLQKPVLVLKSGRTPAGSRAIASHTASLAVNDSILDGALRQAGVLRVESMEELFGALMGFTWMPRPRGSRIALVTYSGAQAIMSLDLAASLGLEPAVFGEETKRRLARVIASPSKSRNPIDIFPDMMVHGFEKTSLEILDALLDDDGVHGIFFISFALGGEEAYRPVVELLNRKRTKPVFFSLLGTEDDVQVLRAYLQRNRIPFFLFPETAVRVFSLMSRYSAWVQGLSTSS